MLLIRLNKFFINILELKGDKSTVTFHQPEHVKVTRILGV